MKHKIIIIAVTLIAGIFLGWLVFHPSQNKEEKHDHSAEVAQGTIWTCCNAPTDKNGAAREMSYLRNGT